MSSFLWYAGMCGAVVGAITITIMNAILFIARQPEMRGRCTPGWWLLFVAAMVAPAAVAVARWDWDDTAVPWTVVVCCVEVAWLAVLCALGAFVDRNLWCVQVGASVCAVWRNACAVWRNACAVLTRARVRLACCWAVVFVLACVRVRGDRTPGPTVTRSRRLVSLLL